MKTKKPNPMLNEELAGFLTSELLVEAFERLIISWPHLIRKEEREGRITYYLTGLNKYTVAKGGTLSAS